MKKRWYKEAYHRNVVDMHITDIDDRFFSEFDPDEYVSLLSTAKVESTVLYATSEAGEENRDTM